MILELKNIDKSFGEKEVLKINEQIGLSPFPIR